MEIPCSRWEKIGSDDNNLFFYFVRRKLSRCLARATDFRHTGNGETTKEMASNLLKATFPGIIFIALHENFHLEIADRLRGKERIERCRSLKIAKGAKREMFLNDETCLKLPISWFNFSSLAQQMESASAATREAGVAGLANLEASVEALTSLRSKLHPEANELPSRLMADASASTQDRQWKLIIDKAQPLVNFAAQFGVLLPMMVASQLTPEGAWRKPRLDFITPGLRVVKLNSDDSELAKAMRLEPRSPRLVTCVHKFSFRFSYCQPQHALFTKRHLGRLWGRRAARFAGGIPRCRNRSHWPQRA